MGIYNPVVKGKDGQIVHDKNGDPVRAPLKLIVVWLVFGGLFFTIFMRFINIRAFKHAIDLIRENTISPATKVRSRISEL